MTSLQQAVQRAWYIRTGTIIRDSYDAYRRDSYDAYRREIDACRRNVVRTNTSGKLRYCIAR